MTPERFSGAWRRTSIEVDRGAPSTGGDVLWVQAGDVYADLRIVPGEPPSCFAGSTSWEAPHLRWHHELDLARRPGALGGDDIDDVGQIDEDGDDLVEAGTSVAAGRTVHYVERWQRLAAHTDELLALVRDDGLGRIVVAGDDAITVVDGRSPAVHHRGCSWRRRLGDATTAPSWEPDLRLDPTVGAPVRPPAPGSRRLPPGGAVELGDGHLWHIAHHQPPRRETSEPTLEGAHAR